MSTNSVADDSQIGALRVLRRETYLLVTLRITGAPRLLIGNKNSTRPTIIVPEIAEFAVRDGRVDEVWVIGPTARKDGKWGAQRRELWSWHEARDSVPAWLAELVAANGGPS